MKINRITILGGGTAGWMAAASLAERYKALQPKIQLIESDSIPSVGVGEATVPGILQLHQHLGINERDFIQATGATFKLGIEFKNWYKNGHRFFHPFAAFGDTIAGQDFYQCWLKLNKEGFDYELEDFCLAIAMAKQEKFAQPHDEASTALALYSYAYHFDASRYARFLREYAEQRGVERIEGKVTEVKQDDNGYIQSLYLENGRKVSGDLFIDCSGFRARLINGAMKVNYESWKHWLPCNRAVTVQTRALTAPTPYTRSTALDAGWQWRIPLQHRVGNGYVYCDQYCDDEKAKNTLMENTEGEALSEIRVIPFEAGIRPAFWHKNCVALGLASGFIEPLESTSISLIQTGIEKLMQFLPELELEPSAIAEANRLNRLEYERIRDFIILHYKSTRRNDSAFWRKVQDMEIPYSLEEKMRTFSENGSVLLREQESFSKQSWIAMYNGFKCIPKKCKSSTQQLDSIKLRMVMEKMRSAIARGAEYAPSHSEFLCDVYQNEQASVYPEKQSSGVNI